MHKLNAEAISHTDLTKPKVTYTHVKQYINEKGEQQLESENISLERYTELQSMFGGTYYKY